jgi:hypothetical protein
MFMCFPTASFISHLFILSSNQVLIASIAVLPCGCAMQCCIHDAMVFLQLLPFTNCFFGLSTYLTENSVLSNSSVTVMSVHYYRLLLTVRNYNRLLSRWMVSFHINRIFSLFIYQQKLRKCYRIVKRLQIITA